MVFIVYSGIAIEFEDIAEIIVLAMNISTDSDLFSVLNRIVN